MLAKGKNQSVHDVLRHLRGQSAFTAVLLKGYDEIRKTALFYLGLNLDLASRFQKTIHVQPQARWSDSAWTEAIAELLHEELRPLRVRALELWSTFETDPDRPMMPDGFFLFVGLTNKKLELKKPRRKPVLSREIVYGTRDYEMQRSRLRRAAALAELREQGEEPQLGKVGYLKLAAPSDPEWAEWVPKSDEAGQVLKVADRAWGRTATTYSALAAHLNAKKLKPLYGRVFTKQMMTRIVVFIELLRGNEL